MTSCYLKYYRNCVKRHLNSLQNPGCTPDFWARPEHSHFFSIPLCCFNLTCPRATQQLCNEDGLEAQPVEPTGRIKDLSWEKEQSSLELFTVQFFWGFVCRVGFFPPLAFCFLCLEVWTHLWVIKLAERKQTQIICTEEATNNKEQST